MEVRSRVRQNFQSNRAALAPPNMVWEYTGATVGGGVLMRQMNTRETSSAVLAMEVARIERDACVVFSETTSPPSRSGLSEHQGDIITSKTKDEMILEVPSVFRKLSGEWG